MRYREHAPRPSLAPFVSCFWEITGGAGAHRVLPDGAIDVIFAANATRARAEVVGPMTRAIVTPADGPAWIVGVRFRPGAAMSILGVAARELLDVTAPVRDVWSAEGRALDEELASARDATAALAILERDLIARSARASAIDPRIDHAVATLRAARGELPLSAVASKANLSERQLERIFAERVGHGPKLFARIVRLQSAIATMTSSTSASPIGALGDPRVKGSWASFARACGYGDQAHMIREFRALSGVTPLEYAATRAMSEIDNTTASSLATFGA